MTNMSFHTQLKNTVYAVTQKKIHQTPHALCSVLNMHIYHTPHNDSKKKDTLFPIPVNLNAHLPWLKQQLSLRTRFLLEPFCPGENALTA